MLTLYIIATWQTAPVTTWAQFCMRRTSARSTTAISMEDRKSAGPPPSSGGGSANFVASAIGDATMMSLCRKSAYSFIAPLQKFPYSPRHNAN